MKMIYLLGIVIVVLFVPSAFADDALLVTNTIGMVLRFVPSGGFLMGSPESEIGRDKDEKQRQVSIKSPFYLGVLEVTRGQWKRLMKTEQQEGDESLPEARVSYIEATAFCDALSRQEEGRIYRLPDEEEWEYACRAGSTSAFAGNGDIGKMGWTYEAISNFASAGSIDDMISHGGVKQPNGWGLFDMHGNLKEWTSSLILANRSKPDPLKPFQSTAASAKPHRVVRGGGLFQEAIHCRSAYRDWELEDTVSTDIGFRVVLVNLPVKGTNEVALPKK